MTGSDGVRRKGAQAKPEGAESCQSSTEPGGILRLFGMLGQEPLGPSCLTPNLHNDRQKQESQDGKEDRLPDAGRREKTSELTQQQADRHEEREAALVGHPTGKMPEQGQMSRLRWFLAQYLASQTPSLRPAPGPLASKLIRAFWGIPRRAARRTSVLRSDPGPEADGLAHRTGEAF